MNKTNFIKLIRETVYNLLEQDSTFKEGDEVRTNRGDEGVIVLAKHPYYSVTLDETGVTETFHYTDLKKVEPFYGKYDTSEAPDLEESAPDELIHLDGLLVTKDGVKLTDVLSDIRSITGITIVRTEDIPGDSRKTKVFIKIDPFPMGESSEEETKDTIKTSIRRIPGVREFWTQPSKPIQELKFRIK
jgi:predicted RNA-binding protein